MKKLSFLAAVAIAAGFASCSAPSPKADFENNVDSLSYAIGMAGTEGLEQYFMQQGIDSAHVADFVKGFNEGASKQGPKDIAYVLGLQVGLTVGNQWVEGYNRQIFGNDSTMSLNRDNLLAGSDNYEVYMETVENDDQSLVARSRSLSETQNELVEFAQGLDGVREVNKSDVVAKTLSSVNALVAIVSIAIIVILFGVSIFLISNTVTMGITVRKEEIAIMKYIGAKDFVVRSPFVIEGLIIGIFGAAIPLTLLYFLYDRAVQYIMTKFSILQNIIDFLPVGTVYQILLPVGLIMGIGIGFLGSFFTVRKHLKV